jgi:hypothetical protein
VHLHSQAAFRVVSGYEFAVVQVNSAICDGEIDAEAAIG